MAAPRAQSLRVPVFLAGIIAFLLSVLISIHFARDRKRLVSISSDLFKMVPIGGVAAIFYRENIRQAATFMRRLRRSRKPSCVAFILDQLR